MVIDKCVNNVRLPCMYTHYHVCATIENNVSGVWACALSWDRGQLTKSTPMVLI